MPTFTNAAWSTPKSDLSPEDYAKVCLIDMNPAGKEKVKKLCRLPIRKAPGGPIYKAALRNAAARLPQLKGVPADRKKKAAKRLVGYMRSAKMDVGDETLRAAGMKVEKALSFNEMIRRVEEAASSEKDVWSKGVFPGYVIVERPDGLFKVFYEANDDYSDIFFGMEERVEVNYTVVKEESSEEELGEEVELVVPILKADEEKQLMYGAVLVPDIPDSQGDVVNVQEIEEAAHRFMKTSRQMDLQHEKVLAEAQAVPVESYLAPTEMSFGEVTLPKGTWILVTHVPDEEIWKAVKAGEIGGYSIKGTGVRTKVKDST